MLRIAASTELVRSRRHDLRRLFEGTVLVSDQYIDRLAVVNPQAVVADDDVGRIAFMQTFGLRKLTTPFSERELWCVNVGAQAKRSDIKNSMSREALEYYYFKLMLARPELIRQYSVAYSLLANPRAWFQYNYHKDLYSPALENMTPSLVNFLRRLGYETDAQGFCFVKEVVGTVVSDREFDRFRSRDAELDAIFAARIVRKCTEGFMFTGWTLPVVAKVHGPKIFAYLLATLALDGRKRLLRRSLLGDAMGPLNAFARRQGKQSLSSANAARQR
jgi:hypothetical protein